MTTWSILTKVSLITMVTALSACVSLPTSQNPQNSQSGRYSMENDSPELEPIDISSVQPVIPVVETRTLAGNKSPYTINGVTYRVMESEAGYSETGFASWYGRKFHGHLTSNGEIYDMFQLTAAHTRLPIPSYIKVTNLDNGKSIVARVNDRGPFHEGRVVDLSYAAATMLGYADKGTARVKVEAIVPGENAPAAPAQPVIFANESVEEIVEERERIDENLGQDYLQIGAFSNKASAEDVLGRVEKLTRLNGLIRTEPGSNGALLHRVRLGPLTEMVDVDALVAMISAANFGTPFKVRQ